MQYDGIHHNPAHFQDTIGSWEDLREMCTRIRKLSTEIDQELDTTALTELEVIVERDHKCERFPVATQAPYPSLIWKARRILASMLTAARNKDQANGNDVFILRIKSELRKLMEWMPNPEPQPCLKELSLVCFLDTDNPSDSLQETDNPGQLATTQGSAPPGAPLDLSWVSVRDGGSQGTLQELSLENSDLIGALNFALAGKSLPPGLIASFCESACQSRIQMGEAGDASEFSWAEDTVCYHLTVLE
jgi:hypothetical protein